jgi:hypothetical protein
MNPAVSRVKEALQIYDLGLAVLPAPADDGKSVKETISGFSKSEKRIPREKVKNLFNFHPNANIAILSHLCSPRLVVVDCDDDAALAAAEARYGYSPLLVSTPRGSGGHLYYHAPPSQVQVRSRNLRRSHGLAIDVKAGPGAVVIVPPSVRPSTGRPYAFSRGSWDDLRSLPVFSEPKREPMHRPSSQPVEEGHRNQHLFRALLHRARGCETLGELENIATVLNERDCSPPLLWAEVVAVTRSASMHPDPSPMNRSRRCGARTRSETFCRSPAVTGRQRCRMHGGAIGSGAPAGNRNALKHGCYSREVLEFRRAMRELLRENAEKLDLV